MWDRLEQIEKHYQELDRQLATPEIAADHDKLQALAQEKAGLEELVTRYRAYRATARELEDTRAMLDGAQEEEMNAMVRQEIEKLEAKLEKQLEEIRLTLAPKDANDDKDIIMEIRAGTGGDEAGLFAADLFRMYSRYAQDKGWAVEIIDSNESGIGGFKEIVLEIKGKGAFSRLKYESGGHRVQRVPTTESSGRIHTSTATVAVLPEADEVEVNINPEDLRIDIFHSGGAGGQNVNKVATAVRITHIPTGLVSICQDERSQLRNRTKAMAVLRARLLDIERSKQEAEITQQRRSQVGSGKRAEKIRTYNYPQDRISDHRLGQTFRNLPRIMDGDLDKLIDTLATSEQAKHLEEQLA
jgi:peptide chain release factor 1